MTEGVNYNLVVVFSTDKTKLLMCRRLKEPYLGLSNFVGGRIEPEEDGYDAAYRELFEETYNHLIVIALKYANNKSDAEDILSNSYLRVLKYISAFFNFQYFCINEIFSCFFLTLSFK